MTELPNLPEYSCRNFRQHSGVCLPPPPLPPPHLSHYVKISQMNNNMDDERPPDRLIWMMKGRLTDEYG